MSGLNVGRALAHGSAWMVGLRWAMRGLGLLSTFVLARLLTPADFGVVAMAMLVVGLVEVFGQAGQQLALIRIPDPARADYDAAWTLGILVALAVLLALWAISPAAALYFHEPRAGWLIRLLALRPFLTSLDNIGVVAFRKELRFGREFAFQLAQKLATVLVTIGCALWLRDERALVAGLLGGPAIGILLSYALHPYRPRPSLARVRGLLAFSGWMLLVNVAQYVHDKADEFVVGGVASAGAMGRYSVAADAATAPTIEVVLPATRALFPVFARLGDDRAAVRAAYLDVFSAAALISVATGLGMALVAGDFVRVALGEQWIAAIPLVRLLAIAGGLYGIMHNGITVLSATGHARLSGLLAASRTFFLVPALLIAGLLGSVETIAATRAVVTLAFIPGIFFAVARVLPVTPADMILRVWRPLAAGAAMAAVVFVVQAVAPDVPPLRLALGAGSGAVAYAAAIVLLWKLARSPEGLESAVAERVLRRGGKEAG
jgi:O-antigen/teichoic acid export membrane protein